MVETDGSDLRMKEILRLLPGDLLRADPDFQRRGKSHRRTDLGPEFIQPVIEHPLTQRRCADAKHRSH